MITHDMRLVCEHADSLLVLDAEAGWCTRASPVDFFSTSGLVETVGARRPGPRASLRRSSRSG